MSDFSAEDIQRAADEVRQGDFWNFMFRDPSQEGRTTRRRRTSRRRTSRQQMTSRMNTSRRNTSRRNTSRRNTSRVRNTSRRNTSRCNTSRCNTSRRNTSRRRTSRCCKWTGWRRDTRCNNLINRCWKDGNMWKLRVRKR